MHGDIIGSMDTGADYVVIDTAFKFDRNLLSDISLLLLGRYEPLFTPWIK